MRPVRPVAAMMATLATTAIVGTAASAAPPRSTALATQSTPRQAESAPVAAPQAAQRGLHLSTQATRAASQSTDARTVLKLYRPFVTGDTRVYDRILAEDWVDLPLSPGQQQGPQHFGDAVDAFRASLTDIDISVQEVIVDDNTIVVRGQWSGTHTGSFLGVAPTGKRVSFRTVDIHHVRNGQLVSTRHLEDLFGAYAQLTG